MDRREYRPVNDLHEMKRYRKGKNVHVRRTIELLALELPSTGMNPHEIHARFAGPNTHRPRPDNVLAVAVATCSSHLKVTPIYTLIVRALHRDSNRLYSRACFTTRPAGLLK